jgi:DNA-binding LacI/PurR family transcriptional regulator
LLGDRHERQPAGALVRPGLTSSRADYALLGQHAAQAVLSQIEDPENAPVIKHWVPSRLVVRESTAPLA